MKTTFLDRQVQLWTESLARKVERRQALHKLFKWGIGTALAVSFGSLSSVLGEGTSSTGDGCGCSFPGGIDCNSVTNTDGNKHKCKSTGGCPSTCTRCTKPDPNPSCIYTTGFWCSCCPFTSQMVLCYDCRCNKLGGGSVVCGCMSNLLPGAGPCASHYEEPDPCDGIIECF